MEPAVLDLLACPRCGGTYAFLSDEHHKDAGVLACQRCDGRYRVDAGVPRLNHALREYRLTNVAKTFGFEWKAHHAGQFETETLFGRTREQDWEMVTQAMGISDADMRGAIVLDAGCGSGRFCELFADHGAATVIGVDMNDAVDDAAQRCRAYDNIHIVQGNIFALPFRPAAFDVIWCNGVIHHTADAAGAHRSLAKHVRPGGILYVWVYPARFNPFRLMRTVLRAARVHRWSPRALQLLASMMARMSLPMLVFYRAARAVPGLRPRSAWGRRSVRHRTLDELKLTWFDALSPEFDSRHTEDEVVGWFLGEGFSDIAVLEEPKVGVRGVAPDRTYGASSH
jgi:2-polyprenyl-3-methyl-5-hydroxy-6-metoxy-1,4-benzoquinol methylase